MERVQLAISDAPYATALRELLERNGTREVCCVEAPDPGDEGVIVVDPDALDHLSLPLPNPERIVLITRNEPRHLALAWDAGIRSVVFNEDPLGTAVLAIMAAELRVPKSEGISPGCVKPAPELAAVDAQAPAKPREGRG
jgi:hypothetical protein